MSETMRRETLADQVAEHVRQVITERGLGPGDPVPTELDITKELGVSRGIVREAFRALAASGLIQVSSGRRPSVGRLRSGVLEHVFSHALVTSQADVNNIMALRQAIEIAAARDAARNRTYAHLDRMKTALDRMATAADDMDGYVVHDFEFHLAVAEASGNPLFALLIEGLHDSVRGTMRAGMRNRRSTEGHQIVQSEHEAIFKAVERSDSAAAERTMEHHFHVAIDEIAVNTARGVPPVEPTT